MCFGTISLGMANTFNPIFKVMKMLFSSQVAASVPKKLSFLSKVILRKKLQIFVAP